MLHVDRLGIMFYFLSPCAPEPCLYILWQLVARRGGQGVEGFNVFGDEGRCHAPTRSGRAAGSTPVDQVGLCDQICEEFLVQSCVSAKI